LEIEATAGKLIDCSSTPPAVITIPHVSIDFQTKIGLTGFEIDDEENIVCDVIGGSW
jgi:hypothetical protein